MRTEPTLRIPFGILLLLVALALYAAGVAWLSTWSYTRAFGACTAWEPRH